MHLLSRYIGGGFGGKGSTYEDLELAALASRELGQPVKIALTRQQMFNATVHRPATVQRVRLGATPDGRLTAFALQAATHCARDAPFVERAANFSRALYAAPNRLTGHRLQKLDIAVASAMRAPGEASGMLSLECAMDELAEQLGLDPIELRIRNEPDVHPETGHAALRAPAGRMHERRRQAVRLGQAQAQARPDPRRRVAGRHGHGRRHPRQLPAAGQGRHPRRGRRAGDRCARA